jgi:uncharacterized iron-regulated protein
MSRVVVVAAASWLMTVVTGCVTPALSSRREVDVPSSIVRRPAPPGVAPALEPLQFVDDGRFAYVDGITGRALSFAEVAARAKAHRVVVIGEQHDQLSHHQAQGRLVTACGEAGPGLAIGLEMLNWDAQPTLDALTRGELELPAFVEQVDWKTVWGFDFALYEPIFVAGRGVSARFVALNAPKEVVRAMRKGGLEALAPADAARIPALDLGDELHRRWFEGIFRSAGHPLKDEDVEGFYRAQVTWDEVMAERAVAALSDGARQVVVIAGAGHVAAGRGIPQRVERRLPGERVLTIVPLTVDATTAEGVIRSAIEAAEADILVIPRFEAELVL